MGFYCRQEVCNELPEAQQKCRRSDWPYIKQDLTSVVTYAEAILGMLVTRECSLQNWSLFQLQPHLLSSQQISFCVTAKQDIHLTKF